VILSTVGSNLKDCVPFGSANATTLDETTRPNGTISHDGLRLWSGKYPEALKILRRYCDLFQSAELQFRMGSCDLG